MVQEYLPEETGMHVSTHPVASVTQDVHRFSTGASTRSQCTSKQNDNLVSPQPWSVESAFRRLFVGLSRSGG